MHIHEMDPTSESKAVKNGAFVIDLRDVDDYLKSHIRSSISILWEAGPGFATRARDILPLDAPLIMMNDDQTPIEDAAERLRGKGFTIAGYIDGLDSSQELIETPTSDPSSSDQLFLLDVADPGADVPDGTTSIPVEHLLEKHHQLPSGFTIGILAGWGVRAASAIGILEASGHTDLVFVRTKPFGAIPPQAGKEVFRVGGPG